ncbi:MAG: RluA family pseudouridine synthase [Actinomycetota bacterium]|nr:RluA family pseudouridine synthase [Actinomycetota bacterium]
MTSFVATAGRLDAVVASLADVPRATAARAIEAGRVSVDGQVRPKSHRLRGGERIEADLRGAPEVEPEPGGVPVRYEDERLAVVAKPAGVLTHPTTNRRTASLVNRLMGMGMPLSSIGAPDRPGIVHRLDRGTSGLLIVAKDDDAHERLVAMLARREVARSYLALVRGSPPHDAFTVEAPLARRRTRVTLRAATGVEATTAFEVRERFGRAAFLEARPRTGRTHQIRVHLRSVGHPILGDRVYGGGGEDATRLGLDRPFLHAWRLVFDHPFTGVTIEVEEPLPADLVHALEAARA